MFDGILRCLARAAGLAALPAAAAMPPEAVDLEAQAWRAADVIGFVGEKISLELYPETPEEVAAEKSENERRARETGMMRISFDARMKAKYRILKVVTGHHAADTIEFITYDHYGLPAFSLYDRPLLYVKNIGGRLVHVRSIHSSVHPTRDGNWAVYSTGSPFGIKDTREHLRAVHPVDFEPALSFEAAHIARIMKNSGVEARGAHYEVDGEKAICRQGLTVDEVVPLQLAKIRQD